jgi:hypothetical protein
VCEISCLADELWASQEGLRAMELVCQLILVVKVEEGARCGAVGTDTAPQAGKSRVRFPMVSLEFWDCYIFTLRLRGLNVGGTEVALTSEGKSPEITGCDSTRRPRWTRCYL